MQILITYDGGQLTNSDLYFEKFKYTAARSTEEQLTFGSCIASKIKFTISNTVASLNRKDLTVYLDSKQLGVFRVYGDKPKAGEPYREITAYDALYRINNANLADWYTTLLPDIDTTMTLDAFRNAFFEHFRLQSVVLDEYGRQSYGLPNGNMIVRRTIDAQQLYGKDIIRAMAEISGCFGHVGSNGVFNFVPAKSALSAYIGKSGIEDLDYENYQVNPITEVVVRGSESDVGGRAGEAGNTYYITANMFALGATQAELNSMASVLLSRMSNIVYTPFKAKLTGRDFNMLGRQITFEGTDFTGIVLEEEISGILAPVTTLSAQGNEDYKDTDLGPEGDIQIVYSRTNSLTRTVDETVSTIERIEGDMATKTELKQTADSLTIQIDTLQKQVDGAIQEYEGTEVPTLKNYPAMDWNVSPIVDETRFRDDGSMAFEYTSEGYAKHARALYFDIENQMPYRFMRDLETGEWYWLEVSNTEYGVLAQRVTALELADGVIEARIEDIYTTGQKNSDSIVGLSTSLTIESGRITTEINAREAADSALGSRISQTLRSIVFEVGNSNNKSVLTMGYTQEDGTYVNLGAKDITLGGNVTFKSDLVDGTTQISGSNITTGTINADLIKAGTLRGRDIVGGSINIGSGNFTVNSAGKLTAKNAEIAGKITATSGSVAGFLVESDGLYWLSPTEEQTFTYLYKSAIGVSKQASTGNLQSIINPGDVQVRKGSTVAHYSAESAVVDTAELKSIKAGTTSKRITWMPAKTAYNLDYYVLTGLPN